MATAEQILTLGGDDALKTNWGLVFPIGIPGSGNDSFLPAAPGGGITTFEQFIQLRVVGDFKFPKEGINKYSIWYKGQEILKLGGTEDSDKTFDLTVRLDQQWFLYDVFRKWLRRTYNPDKGARGRESKTSTVMKLLALTRTSSDAPGFFELADKEFKFEQVRLAELEVSEFDHTSGDPMELNLSFIFRRFTVNESGGFPQLTTTL